MWVIADTEREKNRLGRIRPRPGGGGISATARKENQGGAGRWGWGQRKKAMLDAVQRGPPPPSLRTRREDQAALIPWWVGWVRAGICTLGQAPLAGRRGPAQRQATLMQRGPIVAGPAEGLQLCRPLPRGSSREGGPAQARALGLQPSHAPKLSVLTQEGNTPFMEAPRALHSVHVCVGARRGRGPRMLRRLSGSPQAQPAGGQAGEAGGEELSTCRAGAEHLVLGSPLCLASDSVRDSGQIPDPSEPVYPSLNLGQRLAGKSSEIGDWRGKRHS